jgi:adhesin transport system outer membrane protein
MRPAFLILLAGALAAGAAEAAPGTVPADDQRAFLAVLVRAPQVQALIGRRQAARHLEAAAGRLPDPMLGFGYARKRTPMERMPMYEVMLEQPLPRWGALDAARALAASATRMSDAEIAGEVSMLAADLARARAEVDGSRARLAEGEAEQGRIEALARAIDARVASGDAGVTERLGIDTRRERLLLRLDDLRRTLADHEAGIRGQLGLAPDAALPPFAAPMPDGIDPAQTPAALDAEAQRAQALAELQEARAQRHPETAIGVRAEREASDAGNEDTIGLTVSISLPVARGAIAAGEDAAHARVRAAGRQAEAARWRTTVAVESARRAMALAQRASHLATGLLARAEAEQRALTTAIGSGGGDLTAVFDLLDRLAELRLEVIDAQVAARQAQASLWLHLVPELPVAEAAKP